MLVFLEGLRTLKTKTKDQLRGEIICLQTQCDILLKERDALKMANENIAAKYMYTLSSFINAVKNSLIHNAENWQMVAKLVMLFFADMKQRTGGDFSDEKNIEKILDMLDFDQVTRISHLKPVPI